jgi:hypothetical protein
MAKPKTYASGVLLLLLPVMAIVADHFFDSVDVLFVIFFVLGTFLFWQIVIAILNRFL